MAIPKISLSQVRKMDLFQEIKTPGIVYHMTDKKNIDSIISSGKINSKYDFMNYFFPDLESIPIYIQVTGADHGRKYFDFDGMLHTAPPLNHEKTVVLKLKPRGRQDLEWYKEVLPEKKRSQLTEDGIKLSEYMNNSRICHYGAMPFEKDIEIIELTEIDAMPESEKLKELKKLQGR